MEFKLHQRERYDLLEATAMASPKTQSAAKVTVLQMILLCESECDRIDTWQTVLKAEGAALDPSMALRRMIFRKMADTLEIVLLHQAEFSKIAKARKKVAVDDQTTAG